MKKQVLLMLLMPVVLGGCATRDYVHEYVKTQIDPINTRANAMDEKLTSTQAEVKANQQQFGNQIGEIQVTLKVHADRLAKNEADVEQLSKTAQEALERASVAEKLVGKMTYEVVLSDDKLKFPVSKADLGGVAEAALDEFIARLKGDNKSVYIEIQGHTDSRGEAAANLKLGEARAEAVKRYLSMKGGIPLHRLSTISYGESEPVADNRNRAGRSQNRRVVLVVIQ